MKKKNVSNLSLGNNYGITQIQKTTIIFKRWELM